MAAAASGGGGEKDKDKGEEFSTMTDGRAAAWCAGWLPKRIILVRHGQSQGNIDEGACSTTADYRVALTELEVVQARAAGKRILDVVSSSASEAPNWKVYFYVSPYARTRATLREICTAFPRDRVIGGCECEDPRFQDIVGQRDRGRFRRFFSRFFYRFPDGESGADLYVRVTGFMEPLWRDIHHGRLQEEDDASGETNLVIVSDGLASRVFMMKWFDWAVHEFEGLLDFTDGELRVMQLGPGGEYSFLPHHTTEHLRSWGLSPRMIADQQRRASTNGRSRLAEDRSSFIATYFDNGNEDPHPPPPRDGDEDEDEDSGGSGKMSRSRVKKKGVIQVRRLLEIRKKIEGKKLKQEKMMESFRAILSECIAFVFPTMIAIFTSNFKFGYLEKIILVNHFAMGGFLILLTLVLSHGTRKTRLVSWLTLMTVLYVSAIFGYCLYKFLPEEKLMEYKLAGLFFSISHVILGVVTLAVLWKHLFKMP